MKSSLSIQWFCDKVTPTCFFLFNWHKTIVIILIVTFKMYSCILFFLVHNAQGKVHISVGAMDIQIIYNLGHACKKVIKETHASRPFC